MKRFLLTLIIFSFFLHEHYSQNTLYGVIGDTLVELNINTGDATTVGYMGPGISDVMGMTYYPPTNELLAIADFGTNPRLISINRNTGLASFIGMLDITTPFIDIHLAEGMSYDQVSGNLYAVMTETGPPTGYYCSRLVTVNPSNGNCTQVATISGTCSSIDEFDLITHRQGVMYGIDICPPNTAYLSTSSMVTGAATPVGLTGMFNTSFKDMATHPVTNQIYLSQTTSNTLLTISHVTGVASPVGTTHMPSEYNGDFLTAIAFAPEDSMSGSCNLLNFDGVDDFVELDVLATPLSGSTNNFTIEFWMKADSANQSSSIRTSMFAINPATSNGNGLLIILGGINSQSGNLMIYDEGTFGNNADIHTSQIIGDSLCHHIAYVRNGNIGTVYIDGIFAGSHTTNYNILPTDLISIGQEWDNLTSTPTSSQFYNGDIEDLRVWTVSRSQSQLQANMNNELIGNELGLLAYYQFNQGIASGNNTFISQLVDKTINGYSGNLNGFILNSNVSNFIQNDCVPCTIDTCKLSSNFNITNTCEGDTTYFTDLSLDSLGNIIDWRWYFGDGDSLIGVQNPSHLYASSGNYNVTLIIINDSSCTDTITLPLTINPKFNIIRNDIICQGDSLFFNGNFYHLSGSYTDTMQTILGCDSLLTLNLLVNPSYQFNIVQSICHGDSLFIAGAYQYNSGVYVDSFQTTLGCDSLIQTTLIVNNSYNDSIQISICQGDSILLGGSFQTQSGVYIDSLQTLNGCDSTVNTTLSIDSLISLMVSNDTNTSPCKSIQLNVSGGNTYSWTPIEGLSCNNCANPIVTPNQTTTYTVTDQSNSCNVSASVTIFVEGESEFIIPNVFTPNNDNSNDEFNVYSDCIFSLEKKIYNRWGQLLFHSTQIKESWNGRTNAGNEVPVGTYFYIISVGVYEEGLKTNKVFKGTVTLLR